MLSLRHSSTLHTTLLFSHFADMRMLSCWWLLVIAVVEVLVGPSSAKVYKKCEMAGILERQLRLPRDQIKNYLLSDNLGTAVTCAQKILKSQGYKACFSDLLDDNLIDDLACIQKIIKDTERWNGKGSGLRAWVAYVNKCKNRDLNEYLSKCWSGASNIINIKNVFPQKPANQTENEKPVDAGENCLIINLIHVPTGLGLHTPFSPVLYNSNHPLPRPTVVGYLFYSWALNNVSQGLQRK
nr:lysozyme C-like [Cherax quadricarinatus]